MCIYIYAYNDLSVPLIYSHLYEGVRLAGRIDENNSGSLAVSRQEICGHGLSRDSKGRR